MKLLIEGENRMVGDKIKLADSFGKRLVGLLNRSSLERGEGLLLAPCSSIHTLFMRFPLDVVFLDREYRVVKIALNLKSFSFIFPVAGAVRVLELPAGSCAELKIEAGMILKQV